MNSNTIDAGFDCPARRVAEAFGGVSVVAKICGVSLKSVYQWMKTREDGGTGGIIPSERADLLLKASRKNGVQISAEDFFWATFKK